MVSKIRLLIRTILKLLRIGSTRLLTSLFMIWSGGVWSFIGVGVFFVALHYPAFASGGVGAGLGSIQSTILNSYGLLVASLSAAPQASGLLGPEGLLSVFGDFWRAATALFWTGMAINLSLVVLFGNDAPAFARGVVVLAFLTLFFWSTEGVVWWNDLFGVAGNVTEFLDVVPDFILPDVGNGAGGNVSSVNSSGG